MSFGFSVGDILAGAKLAYTLCQALSESKGAAKEYQDLIAQLNVVHRVLLQVDQLRAVNQLAQATVNALLFSVNSTNESMETFLTQYEAYGGSLKQGGSGNIIKDAYRKGKWATEMPDKVRDLKSTLGTMLSAINCLVSMACYYNTSYNARCGAKIFPECRVWRRDPNASWKDIKLEALISSGILNFTKCAGFDKQNKPEDFFRPGQIFAAQINSSLYLHNERRFREIDFGALPLAPIPELEKRAAVEALEDRAKRLAEIRNLPLHQMTLYCDSLSPESNRVLCLLCNRVNNSLLKEDWASHHFRRYHWEYYFSMLPKSVSNKLQDRRRAGLVPAEKLKQPSPASNFEAENWIDLAQVQHDIPIMKDEELIQDINDASLFDHYLSGPVLIRRFVVVRQGNGESLCLGIHTYARHGCGNQPDQELFGILHSSEVPPPPMPDETRMVLSPVRMKSDHPSTALPRTARIHYGRAYQISHYVRVQSIGLVHDASMEMLVDQFEANMPRYADGDDDSTPDREYRNAPQPGIEPANLDIVKSIRGDITSVLGPKISPRDHQPPQEWDYT